MVVMPSKPIYTDRKVAILSIEKPLHEAAKKYAKKNKIKGGFSGLVSKVLIPAIQSEPALIHFLERRFKKKPGANAKRAKLQKVANAAGR